MRLGASSAELWLFKLPLKQYVEGQMLIFRRGCMFPNCHMFGEAYKVSFDWVAEWSFDPYDDRPDSILGIVKLGMDMMLVNIVIYRDETCGDIQGHSGLRGLRMNISLMGRCSGRSTNYHYSIGRADKVHASTWKVNKEHFILLFSNWRVPDLGLDKIK
jgi:hypothetical protein